MTLIRKYENQIIAFLEYRKPTIDAVGGTLRLLVQLVK
jgi:hypothetical protein